MTQATILNTPASYGAEYVTDGTRYQLTSIRGEASVRFSFQHGGRWHTQRIEAPERFGAVPIANATPPGKRTRTNAASPTQLTWYIAAF